MYEIEWQPKAYRQLKKIKERETLAAIKDAVLTWPIGPIAGTLRL
jgi:mRNA-degrading endonuclease RelE of RelBE toxin-antitoxin system